MHRCMLVLTLCLPASPVMADRLKQVAEDPAAYVLVSDEEIRRAKYQETHAGHESEWITLRPGLRAQVDYPYAYLKQGDHQPVRCNITYGDCDIPADWRCDVWYRHCGHVHFSLEEKYASITYFDDMGNQTEHIAGWKNRHLPVSMR